MKQLRKPAKKLSDKLNDKRGMRLSVKLNKLPKTVTPEIDGKKYPRENVISVTPKQEKLVAKLLGHKGRKGKHGIKHFPYDDSMGGSYNGGYGGAAPSGGGGISGGSAAGVGGVGSGSGSTSPGGGGGTLGNGPGGGADGPGSPSGGGQGGQGGQGGTLGNGPGGGAGGPGSPAPGGGGGGGTLGNGPGAQLGGQGPGTPSPGAPRDGGGTGTLGNGPGAQLGGQGPGSPAPAGPGSTQNNNNGPQNANNPSNPPDPTRDQAIAEGIRSLAEKAAQGISTPTAAGSPLNNPISVNPFSSLKDAVTQKAAIAANQPEDLTKAAYDASMAGVEDLTRAAAEKANANTTSVTAGGVTPSFAGVQGLASALTRSIAPSSVAPDPSLAGRLAAMNDTVASRIGNVHTDQQASVPSNISDITSGLAAEKVDSETPIEDYSTGIPENAVPIPRAKVDANLSFLQSRVAPGVETSFQNMSPGFVNDLSNAIRAAELESGEKISFKNASAAFRDAAMQADIYARSKNSTLFDAAKPGISRHEFGAAVDIASGPARDALAAAVAAGLAPGIERAKVDDPPHFQESSKTYFSGKDPTAQNVSYSPSMDNQQYSVASTPASSPVGPDPSMAGQLAALNAKESSTVASSTPKSSVAPDPSLAGRLAAMNAKEPSTVGPDPSMAGQLAAMNAKTPSTVAPDPSLAGRLAALNAKEPSTVAPDPSLAGRLAAINAAKYPSYVSTNPNSLAPELAPYRPSAEDLARQEASVATFKANLAKSITSIQKMSLNSPGILGALNTAASYVKAFAKPSTYSGLGFWGKLGATLAPETAKEIATKAVIDQGAAAIKNAQATISAFQSKIATQVAAEKSLQAAIAATEKVQTAVTAGTQTASVAPDPSLAGRLAAVTAGTGKIQARLPMEKDPSLVAQLIDHIPAVKKVRSLVKAGETIVDKLTNTETYKNDQAKLDAMTPAQRVTELNSRYNGSEGGSGGGGGSGGRDVPTKLTPTVIIKNAAIAASTAVAQSKYTSEGYLA